MTSAVSTWAPIPLDDLLAGNLEGLRATLLRRGDGVPLLYAGELHAVIGEPESAKGWLVLAAVAEQLAAGRRVVYCDFEDCATNVIGRLVALDVERDAIRDLLSYVRPDEPLTPNGWRDLQPALEGAALVVLDGLTEAYTLQGFDPDSNRHAAEWLALIPRPILAATGAAVVLVDHVTKSREGRGRWAIGAQHKLAGVAAAFSLDVIEPLGRGRTGAVKLSIAKDRHGALREHAAGGRQIALMRVASDGERVTIALEPPSAGEKERAVFRPTALMKRVSEAVQEQPGLSKRAIRMAIKGGSDYIDLALELLTAEGFVEVRQNGQACRHYLLKPYHDHGDDSTVPTVPQPCPNRAAGTEPTTVPTVPSPLRGGTVPGTVAQTNGHGEPCPELEARAERLLTDHADLDGDE